MSLCIAAGGVLFIGAAFYVLLSTRLFLARAHKTKAKVTGYDVSGDDSGGKGARGARGRQLYHAHLHYEVAGVPYDFVSSLGMGYKPYEVGQMIDVLYDPRRPGRAKIPAFYDVWGSAVAVAALGLAALFAAYLVYTVNAPHVQPVAW